MVAEDNKFTEKKGRREREGGAGLGGLGDDEWVIKGEMDAAAPI